ncbi:MAG TPA: RNA polymerase sigma factor [Phycisphaerales bacterium]|nr:RNA polymerase sigma factor [Phycisphaerales bacterium]
MPSRDDQPPASAARRDELRALTARCVRGDEAAFADLASRLRPALVRLFTEKMSAKPDLAEDLAQRTLVGLWQALTNGRYDESRSAVTTFAYAVAHKVWLQHIRAAGRADAALGRFTRLVAVGQQREQPDAAEPAEHAALLESLRSALTGSAETDLTDEERWLVRNWASGQSDRDLAKVMGIAPSNVNVRKQRAYAKLRAYLQRLGFE